MALPNFHTVKVIFISITLRYRQAVVHPPEVTNWRRHRASPGPSRLLRPGLLQALDQGHHAVVPRRGDAGPAPLGGYAAVQDVDLGYPPRQDVLQHARLVVVRLRDGLRHRV